MSIETLMIIGGLSAVVAFFSQASRNWNAFSISLIILVASVLAIGFRLLGAM